MVMSAAVLGSHFLEHGHLCRQFSGASSHANGATYPCSPYNGRLHGFLEFESRCVALELLSSLGGAVNGLCLGPDVVIIIGATLVTTVWSLAVHHGLGRLSMITVGH